MKIARDSLLSAEAYLQQREMMRTQVIPHRQLRSVALGEHIHLRFEDEQTVRYQLQEILRSAKSVTDPDIQAKLDRYSAHVPDGDNWKATMLIDYAEEKERRIASAMLVAIEDTVYVQVNGGKRIYALADKGTPSDITDSTSTHFLQFQFSAEEIASLKAGASAQVGIDHPSYQANKPLPVPTLVNLCLDLT